jgi:DNA-binding transcriptional regulator YiaG
MRRLKAEEVQQIRKELKLTQQELAHELGVAVSTINRWENGKSQPGRMACKLLLAVSHMTEFAERGEDRA